jgi:glycosyltransferase involved in cell wall biosynthesis
LPADLYFRDTSLVDPKPLNDTVYLLLLTGNESEARSFIAKRFPAKKLVLLHKRSLRESGWRVQLISLRSARGEAFVIFVNALSELQEPLLAACSGLVHRCRQTVLADSRGDSLIYDKGAWLRLLPSMIFSAVSDLLVFSLSWLFLHLFQNSRPRNDSTYDGPADLDVAYLYPYPLDSALVGGALSHVKGFLSGIREIGSTAEIFSGRSLPVADMGQTLITNQRSFYLFRESLSLSYNWRFAITVRKLLRRRKVRVLYQRHGRFVIAGALLARLLRVPLILEYNGSEVWLSRHWDPGRFHTWLRLCEKISLSSATTIIVVSEVSRDELIQRGVSPDRILVNPNGVDPVVFHPGCGGQEVRAEFGWSDTAVVVAFVGSFSYWHGIQVLVNAIRRLLANDERDVPRLPLRFLLVGEGPLYHDAKQALSCFSPDLVVFTGIVSHESVRTYLDAADVLVSPHVPMPDGRPFFGSPTKLFEYMAMQKSIVASRLDQLSQVLTHGRNAWLVEPGNEADLAAAISLLAADSSLRQALGRNARLAAVQGHTWKQNAQRVAACVGKGNGCAWPDPRVEDKNLNYVGEVPL